MRSISKGTHGTHRQRALKANTIVLLSLLSTCREQIDSSIDLLNYTEDEVRYGFVI